jgi:hypothetical protein
MRWAPAQGFHQLQPRRGGHRGAPALDVNSATHRVYYTAKLSQQPSTVFSTTRPRCSAILVSIGIDEKAQVRRDASSEWRPTTPYHSWLPRNP